MRLNSLLALAVAFISLGIVATPRSAAAFDWDRPDQPAGWGRERTVRHWVYYPRYREVYVSEDPYAYRYIPRGYYPYYNSNYWRKARIKRFRGHLPPYYQAWGAPRRSYRHVDWHIYHYGGHRRGDW
jgi:hypothetical protein